MKPSIGRTVHFVDTSGVHCAAIISRVDSDTRVLLHIMNPGLPRFSQMPTPPAVFVRESQYDEYGRIDGSWHWPEKV